MHEVDLKCVLLLCGEFLVSDLLARGHSEQQLDVVVQATMQKPMSCSRR